MCGDFFTRMKICMAIIIGVMLIGRADAQLTEDAVTRLGLEKDHTVEQIKEAVSGAYEEAETVMAQKLDGVFEEPYTSSRAHDEQDAESDLVKDGSSAGGAGAGGDDGDAVLREAADKAENDGDGAGALDSGAADKNSKN